MLRLLEPYGTVRYGMDTSTSTYRVVIRTARCCLLLLLPVLPVPVRGTSTSTVVFASHARALYAWFFSSLRVCIVRMQKLSEDELFFVFRVSLLVQGVEDKRAPAL